MAAKKRGLGRGLNALLGDVASIERGDSPKTLPVEFLQRGKYQPRLDMDPDRLQELADSISAQGVVQPIVVRSIDGGRYEIIAGERRWRAAQLAGLHEIPVIIRDVSDQTAVALSLIENIQREDLNPLEEAQALQRLLKEFKMTHQQVADAVGKSRAAVSNLMRLIDLHPDVKSYLQNGALEMGHARALLALETDLQSDAADKVVARGLTVRATEKMVKDIQSGQVRVEPSTDPDIVRLQHEMGEKLGAKVAINHQKSGKGKLVIGYSSLEELEGILGRIH